MNQKEETKCFYDAIAEKSYKDWFTNLALLPTLTTFINHLPNNPIILDLGCGTGGESKRLFNLGAKVIGIDFSEESLKYAIKNAPGIEFILMDILEMNFSKCYFDGVIEAGALFHFTENEQNQILGNIFSYLKKHGKLLSYYPQGLFEGMQEMNVDSKKYKRYSRQLKTNDWIDQVMKIGFKFVMEHEFNVGSFKCVEFIK